MADELITTCAPDAPPVNATDDGQVTSPRAAATVTHAQRVAEGTQLQIHRDTWRYNVLIEDQRRAVLAYRDEVLRTGTALRALERLCPERVAELREAVPDDVLAGAAGQITLAALNGPGLEYLARATCRASTCARSGTAQTRSAPR